MTLPQPLIRGRLWRRYQRFLADIELEDGTIVTAHCPNSGSMLGCKSPGSPVLLSISQSPKRKFYYTWELVWVDNTWIGINTMVPNRVVNEASRLRQIPELSNWTSIKTEVPYGQNSRIDLLLEQDNQLVFVEVKNVTMAEHGLALFPDAVTRRGTKHLNELVQQIRAGHRGVMFYLVQRSDTTLFKPADAIDPVYASTVRTACNNGLEILVYQADISIPEIRIGRKLPYDI